MTNLYLYKISQTQNCGYDTYDSAVVIAKNEDDARNTTPDGEAFGSIFNNWALDPAYVSVQLIGTALEDAIPGVVVFSFNAG